MSFGGGSRHQLQDSHAYFQATPNSALLEHSTLVALVACAHLMVKLLHSFELKTEGSMTTGNLEQ